MSYPDDYDYYEPEPSDFEIAVNEFKDLLRGEIKEEVKLEIARLREENATLLGKMGNLTDLENEARRAKAKYEAEVDRATMDAKREVQKASAAGLIKAIGTTKFSVVSEYVKGPKCDKCNDQRRRGYTTPLGKEAYEICSCDAGEIVYDVAELEVLEVGKRNGRYTVWYTPSTKKDRERHFEDSAYGRVYENPASIEEMVKSKHRDYGFDTREEAQALADALNEERAKPKPDPQW